MRQFALKYVVPPSIVTVVAASLFEVGGGGVGTPFGITMFATGSVAILVLVLLLGISGSFVGQQVVLRAGRGVFVTSLVLYLVLTWVGVIYSDDPQSGLLFSLRSSWYALIFALVCLLMQHYEFRTRLLLLAAAGAIALAMLSWLIVSELQTMSRMSLLELRIYRTGRSGIGDYNVLTLNCMMAAMLALMGAMLPRCASFAIVKWFIVVIFIGVLALISMGGTFFGSRRAILYALTILAGMSLAPIRRSIAGAVMVGVLVVAGAAWLYLAGEEVAEVLLDQAAESGASDTATLKRGLGFLSGGHTETDSRLARWSYAADKIDQLSFGELLIGTGTKAIYTDPRFAAAGTGTDHPHNFLLTALLDGGIARVSVIFLMLVGWGGIVVAHMKRPLFISTFFIGGSALWMMGTSISYDDLLGSRTFLLLFAVHLSLFPEGEQSQ